MSETISINNVFNTTFMDKLKESLDASLAEKKTISRKDICDNLEINEIYTDIISFIVKNKVLDGFEIIPGRYGGIAKFGTKGTKPVKKEKKAKAKLTDEFVAALRETLSELCADGSKHFRNAVVIAMGGTEDDGTDKLISDAFKSGKLPEYKMVQGRYGGISLVKTEDNEIKAANDNGEEQAIIEDNSGDLSGIFDSDEDDDEDSMDLSGYDLDELDKEVRRTLIDQEDIPQSEDIYTA